MFCCPSRSSSARSSASASATRSPPRKRRDVDGRSPTTRFSGAGSQVRHCRKRGGNRAPIFRRYAELGSVRVLKDELEARGINNKSRTSASASGAETRASGSRRTEYAEQVVRSLAFWL